MNHCVSHLTGGSSVFQVIICTKEVSVGARKSAYNLLVEIGNAFVRFCGNAKGNMPSPRLGERVAITKGKKLSFLKVFFIFYFLGTKFTPIFVVFFYS